MSWSPCAGIPRTTASTAPPAGRSRLIPKVPSFSSWDRYSQPSWKTRPTAMAPVGASGPSIFTSSRCCPTTLRIRRYVMGTGTVWDSRM